MTHRILIPLICVGALSFTQARELSVFSDLPEDGKSFNLTTTYNTRYWNEGRDYLANDDLWATSVNYAWQSLTAGVWYAKSTELPYEELQLGLTWRHDLSEDLQIYVGYAYIDYLENSLAVSSEDSENELAFGLTYSGCPWGIVSHLDVYYTDDSGGFFAEASASREWQLSEKWSASITGLIGMNQGYISNGSDGLNHMAVIGGFSYAFSECLSLDLEGVQSWGLDRTDPGDTETDDFLHGRLGLTWTF